MNEQPLEFLALLHLAEGEVVGERLLRWAQAFQAWIQERRARFSRGAAALSYSAWRELLAFTCKPPWQTTVADVEAFVAAQKKRKLRPDTIYLKLSALANFYDYCQAKGIDAQCAAGFNPIAHLHRPRSPRFEKANYLSQKEESALLDAIRRDPSPMGKRDYALILALLRTGWKAGVVRQMRWEQLVSLAPGRLSTGENQGLPGEVWDAVREYLQASGRWAGLQPEEYVFAPSRAALLREARDQPEDWDGSRPIVHRQLSRLLKRYAADAGLKAEKINCHTLRHSAAMRQVEAGQSAGAVGAMLGMPGPYGARYYLRYLARKPKGRLRARKRLDPDTGELVPPGSDKVRSRGPCRAQPRNHLALTHGFYAKYLPEFEWLAEEGKEPLGMDRAIMRWRVVMRRICIVGYDVDNLKDALRYLRLTCLSAHRLCKALKFQREMRELKMQLRWAAFFEARRKR